MKKLETIIVNKLKLFLVTFILSTSKNLTAQKHSFEFSITNLIDKNLNLNTTSLMRGFKPVLGNRVSLSTSLGYNYEFSKKWYLTTNARFLLRKIDYIQNNTVIQSLYQNMIELPIGIRHRFTVNESSGITAEFGGGANLNLTKSASTQFNTEDDFKTQYKFNNSTKPGAFSFIGISYYTKLSERSQIAFNVGYQHQFTTMYTFQSRDNSFIDNGSGVKPSYFYFGITLRGVLKSRNL